MQDSSASTKESNLIPTLNTLKFVENNKGYSREIEAAMTNEVGISWSAAFTAIVGGHIAPGKLSPARPPIRTLSNLEPQQLSLLNHEFNGENPNATVNVVPQLPAAHGVDADKLRHIFRHNGEQLQLMETRLKAANKLDAARRVTYLALLYLMDVDGREEFPRDDLNDILRRVRLYDNNTSTWIGKSADLIVERDLVGLRWSGQEQARKVLAEVLDDKIKCKWTLADSRSSKSNAKDKEDSESSTKNGKRKRSELSKDVEAWVTSWKLFASTIDFHAAVKNCSVTEKGCFGLWGIGKATSNPSEVVSSYKLKQFLYFGLGIKVDERHLERSLQAASGQGSLIKVQSGFQLLSPGLAEVERLLGSTYGGTSRSDSSDNLSEA